MDTSPLYNAFLNARYICRMYNSRHASLPSSCSPAIEKVMMRSSFTLEESRQAALDMIALSKTIVSVTPSQAVQALSRTQGTWGNLGAWTNKVPVPLQRLRTKARKQYLAHNRSLVLLTNSTKALAACETALKTPMKASKLKEVYSTLVECYADLEDVPMTDHERKAPTLVLNTFERLYEADRFETRAEGQRLEADAIDHCHICIHNRDGRLRCGDAAEWESINAGRKYMPGYPADAQHVLHDHIQLFVRGKPNADDLERGLRSNTAAICFGHDTRLYLARTIDGTKYIGSVDNPLPLKAVAAVSKNIKTSIDQAYNSAAPLQKTLLECINLMRKQRGLCEARM